MFRSSGPRTRRPATPVAPRRHAATRRAAEVLHSVQLILAAADPAASGQGARAEPTDRRRREVLDYLHLQGGEVRDPNGFVTRHLRVALGADSGLARVLRAMEADGDIEREIRGTRTYAVRLAGVEEPAAAAHPAPPPGGTDFAALAHALIDMLDKRITVADPDDRARVERLVRYRAAMRRDLAEYRQFVAGEGHGDPAAIRRFCDGKIDEIAGRAAEFERRTGFRIEVAFTEREHETLLRLVALGTIPTA